MIVQRRDMQFCAGSSLGRRDLRRLSSVSLILIHRNTAGDSLEKVRDFHAAPGEDQHRLFPYHFFVDYEDDAAKMGCIVSQVHPLDVLAQHSAGENSKSIGVCLNVDGRTEAPSAYMIERVARLCGGLLTHFPKATIRGHSEEKQCPGKLIPVSYIDSRARVLQGSDDVIVLNSD